MCGSLYLHPCNIHRSMYPSIVSFLLPEQKLTWIWEAGDHLWIVAEAIVWP
jgi:hypothetical protein